MTTRRQSAIALTAILAAALAAALAGCAAGPVGAPSPSSTAVRGVAASPSPAAASAAPDRNCATIGVTVQDVAGITGLPYVTTKDITHGCGYVSTPDAGGRTATAEVLRLPGMTSAAFEASYAAMSGSGVSGTCAWEDARHSAFTCAQMVPGAAQGLHGASQSLVLQGDHLLHLVVATNVPDFASTADHASWPLAQELRRRGI
ncbi:hypothetical protein [Microbacterium capsulatum]|uniref:Lipoprotein n=1 Tax=Microbacterium capsulatum TaxID=3041921 RepID=A0ABU0XCP9_9MICO|nr:hypothetical protein [Microbacterium sp. ASV81]MDQ4212479.1 hypothetical protein [Microbacterium sp. ASV81]